MRDTPEQALARLVAYRDGHNTVRVTLPRLWERIDLETSAKVAALANNQLPDGLTIHRVYVVDGEVHSVSAANGVVGIGSSPRIVPGTPEEMAAQIAAWAPGALADASKGRR